MTTAYPLQWPEGWPKTPDLKRKAGDRFDTTFERARYQLLQELRLLGARLPVISSNLMLRNDGLPYAQEARRRIEDPGVAIYFEFKKRQMVIAQDSYQSVHGNLRSVGLAIAGLRQLERHGGAHMMERAFEGFVALPPPKQKKSWREFLFGDPHAYVTAEIVELQFKIMAKKLHPDAGGSAEGFQELNEAIEAARKELEPK